MKRIGTGMLIGAGWLLLLFADSFLLFWLVMLLVGGLALHEYGSILRKRHQAAFFAVEGLGLLPLLGAYYQRVDLVAGGLVLALVLLFVYILLRHPLWPEPFELTLWAVFGLLTVGFSIAHFVLLVATPAGAAWLLLVTILSTASDTAAYYTGKAWGKTKLCPAISPGKTRAGLAGGLTGGVAAGVIAAFWLFPALPAATMGLTALLLCLLGVAGDLTESMLKRAAGVKDSGTILPGHGGVLDRADSLLLMTPVLFYLVHLGILPGI